MVCGIEELECQASSLIITQFPRTAVLFSNDIDSIPNAPFLVLLLDFKDMRLQISDILCAQTGNCLKKGHATRVSREPYLLRVNPLRLGELLV